MYHPHLRPLTTPLAVLLDLSARLHEQPPLNLNDLLPASLLRRVGSRTSNHASEPQADSALGSMANLLETPPIHVDQVAEAIITILDSHGEIRGPVDVKGMRDVIGWDGRREERRDAEIKVWPVSPATYSETYLTFLSGTDNNLVLLMSFLQLRPSNFRCPCFSGACVNLVVSRRTPATPSGLPHPRSTCKFQ